MVGCFRGVGDQWSVISECRMKKEQNTVGIPTNGRSTLYRKIKEGLALAAQVIITAPVKLPAQVVKGARYLALLIGLLDSLEKQVERPAEPDEGGEGEDAP